MVVMIALGLACGTKSTPTVPVDAKVEAESTDADDIAPKVWPWDEGTTEYRCGDDFDSSRTCGMVFRNKVSEWGCLIVENPREGYAAHPLMHPRSHDIINALEVDTNVWAVYVAPESGERFGVPKRVQTDGTLEGLKSICREWSSGSNAMTVEGFQVTSMDFAPPSDGNEMQGRHGSVLLRNPTSGGGDDDVDRFYWYHQAEVTADQPRRVWSCPTGETSTKDHERADVNGLRGSTYGEVATMCQASFPPDENGDVIRVDDVVPWDFNEQSQSEPAQPGTE